MDFIKALWGINENISPTETFLRALAMCFVAILLIRFSGMRPFGKGNTFDMVIVFLIGSILGRGVVGATPFFSCIAGGIGIVAFHTLFSKLSIYSRFFEKKVKGKSILLYADGKFLENNMKDAKITEKDIYEELRLVMHQAGLEKISMIFLERTGEISFVLAGKN